MIRLVLDPGVLVSAAISPSGTPAALLKAIREGDADIIVSPRLLDELRDVLARPKLRRYLTAEQAERFADLIERLGINAADPPDPARVSRDPGDDYLVALATAASAHALVSGDADLTTIEAEPPVLVPRVALERLERSRRTP